MRITARVRNAAGGHEVVVATGGAKKTVAIAAKAAGRGSAINGGELLLLALATCYCNDLFREAGKRGLPLDSVEVEVDGDLVGKASRPVGSSTGRRSKGRHPRPISSSCWPPPTVSPRSRTPFARGCA